MKLAAAGFDFIGVFDQASTLSRLGSPRSHRGHREECLYDPIGPSPRRSGFGRAGGRYRLEKKLCPEGLRFLVCRHLPTNQKRLSSVPSVSRTSPGCRDEPACAKPLRHRQVGGENGLVSVVNR